MKIGNVIIKNKVVIAPLAGYTNLAYRKIMKKYHAGLVYTEMISAKGLLYENDKTWELTKIDKDEHPVSLQLFGGTKEDLVKATQLLENRCDADIIDINMGCPIKKVLKSDSGSKLLLDVDKIYDIVSGVVAATKKPVTVKIRAGWDHDSINCVEVAKAIEKAGASAIAIHGRTKSDLYSGKCNLDYIKVVKENVRIPVIGNGDIKTVEDALYMLEYTKCDAIMIGRGTIGNPWLVRDIVYSLEGKELGETPTKETKISEMLEHYQELIKVKSEKIATMEMRTLASYYTKGIVKSKEFKIGLINIETKAEFYKNVQENLNYKMS